MQNQEKIALVAIGDRSYNAFDDLVCCILATQIDAASPISIGTKLATASPKANRQLMSVSDDHSEITNHSAIPIKPNEQV